MVIDLVPFHEVNKPGFLRNYALIVPNFEVASDKYYRDMLEPTYTKIKESLLKKLDSDAPLTISVGLDGWSAHHHSYMGMNAHYLDDNWCRVKFCLGMAPMDEKHTGLNIHDKLNSTLLDWSILSKTGLCLRDNAANMVAAFNVDGCVLDSVGCLNHTLQLCIHDEIFDLPSNQALIEKSRRLLSHANMSGKFYNSFHQNQKDLMGGKPKNLKGDVDTR